VAAPLLLDLQEGTYLFVLRKRKRKLRPRLSSFEANRSEVEAVINNLAKRVMVF